MGIIRKAQSEETTNEEAHRLKEAAKDAEHKRKRELIADTCRMAFLVIFSIAGCVLATAAVIGALVFVFKQPDKGKEAWALLSGLVSGFLSFLVGLALGGKGKS